MLGFVLLEGSLQGRPLVTTVGVPDPKLPGRSLCRREDGKGEQQHDTLRSAARIARCGQFLNL